MTNASLSERDICTKFITPALASAGWDVATQIREEVSFTKGRIIVRGKLVTRGKGKRADYVLYYKPNILIALIEAKDGGHSVGNCIQQALDYAETLDIPYVFSSNGTGFVFHDRTGVSAEKESNLGLGAFPAPAVRGAREREPWNGEFYASFGHSSERSWDEARKCGFISAGGGAWYSNTLKLLNIGDRVWVKAPGYGFVGVGEVTGAPQSGDEYMIPTSDGSRPALEALTGGTYHREFANDPERIEHFLPIRWLHTVPLDQGVNEIGLFGNQNTVCKPTTPKWRSTVERLKERWPAVA